MYIEREGEKESARALWSCYIPTVLILVHVASSYTSTHVQTSGHVV